MAILAIIRTAFAMRFPNAFIFNTFQASKMPAHPFAGKTRNDQRFPNPVEFQSRQPERDLPQALSENTLASGARTRISFPASGGDFTRLFYSRAVAWLAVTPAAAKQESRCRARARLGGAAHA